MQERDRFATASRPTRHRIRQNDGKVFLAPQLCATLFSIFGGIGLVLAAAGLFGVVSYAVRSRTREIGLRIALGATTPALLRLVVAQALAIIGAGLVAGLTIAAAVTRFTATLLYDVRPADPITIAAVPLRGMAEPFVAGQHPRVGYRGLQQSPTGPCD